MAQAFFGGIHPNDMKAATNGKPIEQLAPPAQVVIPMSQHIGRPCNPIVKVGDRVKIGQKIGEPAASFPRPSTPVSPALSRLWNPVPIPWAAT
jgi:Na+-translocating ferredoxin:NAD+ oxidoreductase RnfC subunit